MESVISTKDRSDTILLRIQWSLTFMSINPKIEIRTGPYVTTEKTFIYQAEIRKRFLTEQRQPQIPVTPYFLFV